MKRVYFIVMMWALGLCAGRADAAEVARLQNGFGVRYEHRTTVGGNTRLYLTSDSSGYVDVPTAEISGYEEAPVDSSAAGVKTSLPEPVAASVPLGEVIGSVSRTYDLDPDLLNSVIRAESGFNPRAVSRKGAQGLMQLMPKTAATLGVADPLDAAANVDGGSRYLRALLEHYNFDLIKALAAYNAGPERVAQYGGVPPYRETRAYVARIVHDYNRKKRAAGR